MDDFTNCLTSPVDVKKVANMVDEMAKSLTRQQAEVDLRKEIASRIKDEYNLPPSESNKAAKALYKGTSEFDKSVEKEERRQFFMEQIFHTLKQRPQEE